MTSHIFHHKRELVAECKKSILLSLCLAFMLIVMMVGICSCAPSSKDNLSQITPPSKVNLQSPKYTLLSNGQIVANDNSTDENATSAINEAAQKLGVPFNGHIKASIGEKTYEGDNGETLINISFYKNGELCAGAKCSLDGTPVANIVYY